MALAMCVGFDKSSRAFAFVLNFLSSFVSRQKLKEKDC